MRADLKRLKRDSSSGKVPRENGTASTISAPIADVIVDHRTSSVTAAQELSGNSGQRYALFAAAGVALLTAGIAAYHFWPRSNTPAAPAKITQISHWDKPMNNAKLSPDGHTVAFSSPVDGVSQIFVMLASGGEPLRLTSDDGDKIVSSFSPDGTEIYYHRVLGEDEIWGLPTLGGEPKRIVSGVTAQASSDGTFIFYAKTGTRAIFRANRNGLGERQVGTLDGTPWPVSSILPFPDSAHLFVASFDPSSFLESMHAYILDLSTQTTSDLGLIPGDALDQVWEQPGKTILFPKTVNGLTNIWRFALQDKSLTQVTFGTGPDASPMPDPSGKGMYIVNGKPSGYLTAYNPKSKQFKDIASENATQPAISHDGKRVMYITAPSRDRTELWVSRTDGIDKIKIGPSGILITNTWSRDDSRLSFVSEEVGKPPKIYVTSSKGGSLHALPWDGGAIQNVMWSADERSIYINSDDRGGQDGAFWQESVDGSPPEKVASGCGWAFDVSPKGNFILSLISAGDKVGIYEYSLVDRKCTPLLPGVLTAIGKPQIVLKLPFAFPLVSGGNAYDFSRDLSTVVYARPSGHADLYLLSQK